MWSAGCCISRQNVCSHFFRERERERLSQSERVRRRFIKIYFWPLSGWSLGHDRLLNSVVVRTLYVATVIGVWGARLLPPTTWPSTRPGLCPKWAMVKSSAHYTGNRVPLPCLSGMPLQQKPSNGTPAHLRPQPQTTQNTVLEVYSSGFP